MTNETTKLVVNKYNQIKKEQEKIIDIKKQLDTLKELKGILEENEYIKFYNNVCSQIDKLNNSGQVISENQIVLQAAEMINLSNDTSEIFIYDGKYRNGGDFNSYIRTGMLNVTGVEDDSEDYDFVKYISLESDTLKQILKQDKERFEKENIIIHIRKDVPEAIFYQNLKTYFFDYVIKYGREEAVSKMKTLSIRGIEK